MKVLMISGDPRFLEEGSSSHRRFLVQKSALPELDVVVWPRLDSTFAILRNARKEHYDVVTAQDPFWRGLLAWRVARMTGAKLNIQVHADLRAVSIVRRAIARRVLRHADSIRVVSEKLQTYLRALGVRGRVTVLPVFIDPVPFSGLTHRHHPRFEKVILWIGRLEPEKNPIEALSILEEVRAAGIPAGLVFLGSGSLERSLHANVGALLPYVEFAGWHDPVSYIQMADVVLCTSQHESYGASMIESLASGVPVVAPDVGIAKEAGAIVVPKEELAHAVTRVLQEETRGTLRHALLSREEWAARWRESLV